MNLSLFQIRLLLLLLSSALFFPFLGTAPLFDWDEVNFAESAREMILTGNYNRVQINFQPFWEKPPLFFWLQVLSMKLFGINEYAARFPNALAGVATILVLFEMGRMLRGKLFGFLAACAMLCSFLPHIYFKSGIIDPLFNLFIFASVWQLYLLSVSPKKLHAVLAGAFVGLAVLTKGPAAILIILLVLGVKKITAPKENFIPAPQLILFMGTAALVSMIWFLPETIQNGPWFIEEFIRYQIRLFSTPDAGHAQPIYYHFVVVLIGCFPMSAFALQVLFRRRNELDLFIRWSRILLWVVLILFSIVTTKIIHYSSLAYLPLSMLAAYGLEEIFQFRRFNRKLVLTVLGITGTFMALPILVLPLAGMNTEALIPYIKDPFAVANLAADVKWSAVDFLPGALLMAGLIFAMIMMGSNKQLKGIYLLFVVNLAGYFLFLMLIPGKIAGYTQQAAVDFYTGLQGRDVYVETLHFKSYAQYFYFRKPEMTEAERQNSLDAEGNYHIDALRRWYLYGEIDKPVYFVVKSIHEHEYLGIEGVRKTGEKNGFSFLYREIPAVSPGLSSES